MLTQITITESNDVVMKLQTELIVAISVILSKILKHDEKQ